MYALNLIVRLGLGLVVLGSAHAGLAQTATFTPTVTQTPTVTATPTFTPVPVSGCCAGFFACENVSAGGECFPDRVFMPGKSCVALSCIQNTPTITVTPTTTPTRTPTPIHSPTTTPTTIGANVCCNCPGNNCTGYPCGPGCTPIPNASCVTPGP